jgi:hypothetical protein
MLLIVPADPLNPRRVDAHFDPEAVAARELGIPVAVVDHDVLAASGDPASAVVGVPVTQNGAVDAVYRGWMLRSEQYAAMAAALAARGVVLRTTAQQYRAAHELPGWYPALAALTPASVWTVGAAREDFDRARAQLGPGAVVLKDYVKSMKHAWREAAFIPEGADADAAWRVVTRFLELREEDLVGGLVLRRYERFASAEARTWWVDGTCALIGPHPDTPHQEPPSDVDIAAISPVVAGLGLRFVTVDLARRDDGAWRVVELGDAQVSDRPTTLDPTAVIRSATRSWPGSG